MEKQNPRVLPKYATLTTSAGDYLQPAFVTQQLFDSATSYKPENSDVFVCAFPKNGGTWMVGCHSLLKCIFLYLKW